MKGRPLGRLLRFQSDVERPRGMLELTELLRRSRSSEDLWVSRVFLAMGDLEGVEVLQG